MKERPILMSGEMVCQILAGTKTQTRRPIGLSELRRSDTPGYDWTWRGKAPVRSIAQQKRHPGGCWQEVTHNRLIGLCPYGAGGDRLWVRETWRTLSEDAGIDGPIRVDGISYRAGGPFRPIEDTREAAYAWVDAHDNGRHGERWRPSIFMPRWASRITRDVLSVRVERLHDISEEDIVAEGVTVDVVERMTGMAVSDLRDAWQLGWTHLYGAESWASNPWLWCVSFRRVQP